jgi:hypothetical protein
MNDTRLNVGAAEDQQASKEFSALASSFATPRSAVRNHKHWGYRLQGRTYHIGVNGATEPAKGDLSLEALGG